MKKPFSLTIAAALAATAAYGQGTINFANSLSSVITAPGLTLNGLAPVGTRLELLYQPGGGTAPAPMVVYGDFTASFNGFGAWEATAGSNPFTLGSTNGRFAAGGQTTGTDVPGGANAWLTVIGWTGGWADIQTAIANGAAIGESSIFELTTGNPNSVPPGTPVNLTAAPVAGTAFSGVVLFTPEPSTIAIGTLGAAALLFFRRRNQSPKKPL